MKRQIRTQTATRARRVRTSLAHRIFRPRLSVFRSHRHLWVQLIDDQNHRTLASGNTRTIKTGTKTEKAQKLGTDLGKQIISQQIRSIRFDRGPYRYHGRIQALADSLRQAGLQF